MPICAISICERSTSSFSQYAAFSEWKLAVGDGDAARERTVAGVSASFFEFFDARPVLGRFFDATEDVVPRGASVAVLSYGFWQTEFGGRNVLGQSLQVGPLLTTIIGVAPKGFVGVVEGEPPAVILPITTYAYGLNQGNAETFATRYNWDLLSVIVRRKPGVTTLGDVGSDERVRAEPSRSALDEFGRAANERRAPARHRRCAQDSGRTRRRPRIEDAAVGHRRRGHRAAHRLRQRRQSHARARAPSPPRDRRPSRTRRERPRLAGQLLTESLILALLGCVAGVAIAQWVSAALRSTLVRDGSSSGLAMQWRTLAVACALALVAGIITALGPALLAVRGDLAATLRAGAREGTYQRSPARSALLIMQAALSVVLLVGSGLL